MNQEATPQVEAPASAPSEAVDISDINQFAGMVAVWFKAKQDQLKHLLTVPAGATFEIDENAETSTLILDGSNLTSFKFGIELALMQLGELPFVVEFDEAPAEAPAEAIPG